MASENFVLKGKEYVLLVRNDADTLWEIVGGVRTRGSNFNNPTEEVTSSSTTSEFTEREFTGYSDVSIAISGVIDVRAGVEDPATGYNIVNANRLAELSAEGNRCGKFKLISVNAAYTYIIEGEFTITSYNTNGDTPGLLQFDAALESRSDVTITTA